MAREWNIHAYRERERERERETTTSFLQCPFNQVSSESELSLKFAYFAYMHEDTHKQTYKDTCMHAYRDYHALLRSPFNHDGSESESTPIAFPIPRSSSPKRGSRKGSPKRASPQASFKRSDKAKHLNNIQGACMYVCVCFWHTCMFLYTWHTCAWHWEKLACLCMYIHINMYMFDMTYMCICV